MDEVEFARGDGTNGEEVIDVDLNDGILETVVHSPIQTESHGKRTLIGMFDKKKEKVKYRF